MPPKAAPPPPPPVNTETYLKDASKSAREDEVADGPEGNWEVAYVYAFIDRFTDLRKVEYGSAIKSVFDLEQALLASSPPAKLQRKAALAAGNKNNGTDGNGNGHGTNGTSNGNGHAAQSCASSLSSLSDDEEPVALNPMPSNPPISIVPPVLPTDTPIPPPSDALVHIIETFKDNLSAVPDLNDYHGRKTWLTWLINFVGKRMQDKFFGGFRWETNLLRTRGLKPGQEEDKMFWLMRWEDKIHLFRQLVDFQLCTSPAIRDKVQQGYDLGHQRNALRSQALNPLIVEPLGTTLSKRQVFHIDETPRLYSSSAIPAKSTQSVPPVSSGWATLSSSTAGYKAFLLSLPEPAPVPGAKKPAATGTKRVKGPKPGSKEDPKREERAIRANLEQGLEKLAKFDEALAEIDVKERRVAARRADADARLARTISRTVNASTSTRSTRQKTGRSVNYANDGVGEDEEEIDELEEDDEEETMGRGKRRKTAAGLTNEDDWETSSVASGSNSGRRGGARARAPVIPGERRSSRVQSKLKDEGHEVGSEEVDELEEDGQHSRKGDDPEANGEGADDSGLEKAEDVENGLEGEEQDKGEVTENGNDDAQDAEKMDVEA
ncbi:hypothetical protein JCM16303_006513 [Sporobolomyces ruberrimus]